MKNTNPIFSLKNFRSFGEEGADFELAPITVLTGCNSAGKSSMAKALLLMSKLEKERDRTSPMKLYAKDLGFGQFGKVVNEHAKHQEIVLSYKIWSDYLQEMVIVRRYFRTKSRDALSDGYMNKYTVEKEDGTIFYEQKVFLYGTGGHEAKCNNEAISHNFKNYMLVRGRVFLEIETAPSNPPDKEYEERRKEYVAELTQQLNRIKNKIEKLGINPDSYNYKKLYKWNEWITERYRKKWELKESIKKAYEDEYLRIKYGLSESEVFEIDNEIERHFPESDIPEQYMEFVIDEVYFPWFLENISYINSTSAVVQRVYSMNENGKMSSALCRLNDRIVSKEECDIDDLIIRTPGMFVDKWLKEFGLGDGIEVSSDDEGGLKIFLKKKGDTKRLLADEGYGITQLVSLLLLIDNAIKEGYEEETPIKDGKPDYKNETYPRPNQLICVEEPEIHLHPKYQSLLADMFVEAYQKYNIHFIIETHSEYLIRKLQVMVADKGNALTPNDVSLNYVEKDEHGISTNRKIDILEDGRLSEPFGPGFYDEADGLAMELMEYKARRK